MRGPAKLLSVVVVAAAVIGAVLVVAGPRLLAAWQPGIQRRLSAALGTDVYWVADPAQQHWRLAAALPAGGLVTLQGPRHRWRHPQGDLVFHQVTVGPVTVSTTAHWDAQWTLWPPGLRGTVTTAGSTVNHQVVGEAAGAWRLGPRGVTVSDLALGARWRLSGSVGWMPPYPATLVLDAEEADAARVAALIEPGKNPLAGGIVQGRVTLTGTLSAPQLRGTLSARHGKLGATAFETATVQFEGEGTVIRFADTQLRQPGAVVVVEGFLDVTKLGTPTVFQDMRLTAQPPKAATARMALHRTSEETS